MADNLRKYKSLYSSTTNTFGTGTGETITPASVSGLPTDTEITLTFDRVDSTGTETPSKMERIKGTISGGNFVITTRATEGTEQSHTSPVVEMIWNADDWNDMVDMVLTEHNQDGTHGSITTAGNISASAISASSISLTGNVSASNVSASSVSINGTDVEVAEVTSITSSATPTPTGGSKKNELYITALGEAAEFAEPSGTPANGNSIIIRVLDDGTGRALTYNAIYDGLYDTLPSTTTANKTLYMGFIYNSEATKWEMLATVEEE